MGQPVDAPLVAPASSGIRIDPFKVDIRKVIERSPMPHDWRFPEEHPSPADIEAASNDITDALHNLHWTFGANNVVLQLNEQATLQAYDEEEEAYQDYQVATHVTINWDDWVAAVTAAMADHAVCDAAYHAVEIDPHATELPPEVVAAAVPLAIRTFISACDYHVTYEYYGWAHADNPRWYSDGREDGGWVGWDNFYDEEGNQLFDEAEVEAARAAGAQAVAGLSTFA